jgi:hypothetical protein
MKRSKPKPRSLSAKALASPVFRQRTVPSKLIYKRKPRTPSGASDFLTVL